MITVRTAPTVTELYLQHRKMIYFWAWKMHFRTNIPLEELISEGNLIFMKAVRGFQSKRKVKFSTMLYIYLHNNLLSFCKEWQKQVPETVEELPDIEVWCDPARGINLRQTLKKLSAEAQGVAYLLLECPGELLALADTCKPKLVRGALGRYLKGLGWPTIKVQKAFAELRVMVSGL